jgi:hypothetical protein
MLKKNVFFGISDKKNILCMGQFRWISLIIDYQQTNNLLWMA